VRKKGVIHHACFGQSPWEDTKPHDGEDSPQDPPAPQEAAPQAAPQAAPEAPPVCSASAEVPKADDAKGEIPAANVESTLLELAKRRHVILAVSFSGI